MKFSLLIFHAIMNSIPLRKNSFLAFFLSFFKLSLHLIHALDPTFKLF